MTYKEVNSLDKLKEWLKECSTKKIWVGVVYRDGILQVDWGE
jgi:hypothetical protein